MYTKSGMWVRKEKQEGWHGSSALEDSTGQGAQGGVVWATKVTGKFLPVFLSFPFQQTCKWLLLHGEGVRTGNPSWTVENEDHMTIAAASSTETAKLPKFHSHIWGAFYKLSNVSI